MTNRASQLFKRKNLKTFNVSNYNSSTNFPKARQKKIKLKRGILGEDTVNKRAYSYSQHYTTNRLEGLMTKSLNKPDNNGENNVKLLFDR